MKSESVLVEIIIVEKKASVIIIVSVTIILIIIEAAVSIKSFIFSVFHNCNSVLTFYSSHHAPNEAVILCLNVLFC